MKSPYKDSDTLSENAGYQTRLELNADNVASIASEIILRLPQRTGTPSIDRMGVDEQASDGELTVTLSEIGANRYVPMIPEHGDQVMAAISYDPGQVAVDLFPPACAHRDRLAVQSGCPRQSRTHRGISRS